MNCVDSVEKVSPLFVDNSFGRNANVETVEKLSTVIVDNLNVGKEEAQEVKLSTVIVDNSVENCVEVS